MELTRIMHVENDESIRMITEMALVDVAGFELLSCDGGQSALEQAEAFAPELVLLDVMMPKMDGLQTLAELRKLPLLASTPVVFMTAKIQQAEKQQYLDAGAIAVVEKPFEPMELGDTLRALYQQARQA
ncbi:response regulator [Alkalimonas sp. MEB108]|uniref:Response regulator n=2 Tax=Alkalimonas cellulosilytica TaxID=3058395 RepID=A0ABU7J3E4_9GAMM|nr:response regulator [Alkalimonas sp. MEB108]MEE2001018.1 response regulator [Alkalimonas sp. MEB108]